MITKDSTYQTISQEPHFNWNDFFAKGVDVLTEADWEAAKASASEWTTCACGNQCISLPRLSNGEPADYTLAMLGYAFNDSIASGLFMKAHELLEKIEARSSALIAEMSDDEIQHRLDTAEDIYSIQE